MNYIVRHEDTTITERTEQCATCFGVGATDFDRIRGRLCRTCGGRGAIHITEVKFDKALTMRAGDTLTIEGPPQVVSE